MPEDRRDLALSQTAREPVVAAITADAPAADPGGLPLATAAGPVLGRLRLRNRVVSGGLGLC